MACCRMNREVFQLKEDREVLIRVFSDVPSPSISLEGVLAAAQRLWATVLCKGTYERSGAGGGGGGGG